MVSEIFFTMSAFIEICHIQTIKVLSNSIVNFTVSLTSGLRVNENAFETVLLTTCQGKKKMLWCAVPPCKLWSDKPFHSRDQQEMTPDHPSTAIAHFCVCEQIFSTSSLNF